LKPRARTKPKPAELPENPRRYVEKLAELIGTKLAIVSVGPDRKVDLTLSKDTHYRMASIHVVARNGEVDDYTNCAVRSDVKAGQTLDAWIDYRDKNRGLIYAKAINVKDGSYTPDSPFFSWEELLFLPALLGFMVMTVGMFFSSTYPRITWGPKPEIPLIPVTVTNPNDQGRQSQFYDQYAPAE